MIDIFTVKQMLPLLRIPAALYRAEGDVLQVLDAAEEEKLIEREKVAGSARDFPQFQVEENGVAWALFWSQEDGCYLGLGKFRVYDFGDGQIREYPYCPPEQLAAALSILWKMASGQEVRAGEILERNTHWEFSVEEQLTRDIFRRQEEGARHIPYSQEVREQECIARGDVAGLQECFLEPCSGQVGALAADMVRRYKNRAICVIALAAKSAIQGGLFPELVYSLADTFIYQIEEQLTDPIKIQEAARTAQLEYARRVSGLREKSGSDPFVNQVRDYVFCHIHEPILVREVAEHMGVSPNYLSERFHGRTGMTLKQYIIEEKILVSEKMLKYTDYTLQEISNICAFSSQSRFIEYFRRKNGIPPAKYRKKFGLKRENLSQNQRF